MTDRQEPDNPRPGDGAEDLSGTAHAAPDPGSDRPSADPDTSPEAPPPLEMPTAGRRPDPVTGPVLGPVTGSVSPATPSPADEPPAADFVPAAGSAPGSPAAEATRPLRRPAADETRPLHRPPEDGETRALRRPPEDGETRAGRRPPEDGETRPLRRPPEDGETRVLRPPSAAETRSPETPVPDADTPGPAAEQPSPSGEVPRPGAETSSADPAPPVADPTGAEPALAGGESGEAGASGGGAAPVPEEARESGSEAAPAAAAGGTQPAKKKLTSAGAWIWVLLLLLGYTLVVQLRSNNDDQGLATTRQEDLVSILSDLESRDSRLQTEITSLESSQRQLTSGVSSRQAALAEAEKRADELGLLAGTLPGKGPGLKITIDRVKASEILNAVQELRGSGGEVMELAGADGIAVRIVASSYFVDAQGGGIDADGTRLAGPWTLWVIGSPQTMQTALQIPGGVVASINGAGGSVTMETQTMVQVTAVRKAGSLQYAKPAS
jgi:uncharacterized protein YlxW (UPF0749 family)